MKENKQGGRNVKLEVWCNNAGALYRLFVSNCVEKINKYLCTFYLHLKRHYNGHNNNKSYFFIAVFQFTISSIASHIFSIHATPFKTCVQFKIKKHVT